MSDKIKGVYMRVIPDDVLDDAPNAVAGGELEVCGYEYEIRPQGCTIFTHEVGRSIRNGVVAVGDIAYRNIAPLVRQSDAQAQIAALEAEVVRLRSAVIKTSAALERVTEERMTSYQEKNGRWVSIQGHDGERCDIIHSDITTDCEEAILTAQEALKGGAV